MGTPGEWLSYRNFVSELAIAISFQQNEILVKQKKTLLSRYMNKFSAPNTRNYISLRFRMTLFFFCRGQRWKTSFLITLIGWFIAVPVEQAFVFVDVFFF